MDRAADYVIQGFQYQFNKTLLEILKSSDDSIITIEGIIEDIEIVTGDITSAIQCKYHEANTAYSPSAIYKPLLLMMNHFHLKSGGKVNYVLFAHFPTLTQETFIVDKKMLQDTLKSKNKELLTYINKVKDGIDLDAFLQKFSAHLGPSYDTLVSEACALLQDSGIAPSDVHTLAYPNAIQLIAEISIQHDASRRTISRAKLLTILTNIKKTAISQWTLSLKTRHILLSERRKQLKSNLSKNARLRYFLVHSNSLQEFDSNIVIFISDYLDKFHFKAAHVSTPVFCFAASKDQLHSIELRLHQKGITPNSGYVANVFDESWCMRDPMIQKTKGGELKREFHIRLLCWPDHEMVLSNRKCDDLFVLGMGGIAGLNTEDVNVEELGSESFDEIKYMMGLADVYK